MGSFYTYVLISKDGKRTYTGYTSDFKKRLDAHNNGEVVSSKRFRPYELLHKEEFDNKREARTRELFFKSSTGRRRLKSIIDNWYQLRKQND
jgi:putative endonuclease